MARDSVGIQIDDSAIRVVGLSGRRPRAWAVEPLDTGLVRDGLIVDETEVAKRIEALWSNNKIGSRTVVAGISGINCLYRFIVLPELPHNLLPEAVAREGSRAFGVSTDELYISWQALPSKPGETQVYVVAASRTTVDGQIRCLRKAGLHTRLMDIAPLAICRATSDTNCLIVDLQPRTLDVIVKMDGLPEVIRSISIPADSTSESRVNLARQELQRAVTFFNSGRPDNPLADEIPILVGGQLAEQPSMWPSLLGRVERRVEAVSSPIDLQEEFPGHDFLPAVGLALKETSGKAAAPYARIDFNALPASYLPKPRPLSELLYPPVLLAGVACLAIGGYFLFNSWNYTNALKNESSAMSERALSLGSQLSERKAALEQEQASLVGDTEAKEIRTAFLDEEVRGYESNNASINGDLGEINKTPSSVDLDSVVHDVSVINVTGWGDTEGAVFSYARQLRSSGRFDYVVVTSLSTTPEQIETYFTIILYKGLTELA